MRCANPVATPHEFVPCSSECKIRGSHTGCHEAVTAGAGTRESPFRSERCATLADSQTVSHGWHCEKCFRERSSLTPVCECECHSVRADGGIESVDHPKHYGGADDPFEHVKVAEAKGWDRNAFIYNCTKYLWRLGQKGDILEDLRKSRWYLDREIRRMEKIRAQAEAKAARE